MAKSGSFSGSIISGKYKLQVDWSATQSVTNNTSKITATMYLVQASGWALAIGTRNNDTTINGTAHTWTSPAINNNGGASVKLGTVTSADIAHNADGSKSVTLSATFNIRATINGTYYEKITASATIALDTIPRATMPTLSATSADMGTSITIRTPRASSSFTHDLSYKFAGGSWVTIATGVATSKTWEVPDLAASIPNAGSGIMTIRCITKNGATTIGTTTTTLTVRVPASVIPVITSVQYTEATEGLAEQFGAFIAGKSALTVTIEATGAKGSTITEYHGRMLDTPYRGQTFTTDILTGSGELGASVKDSRIRWAERQAYWIDVLPYTPPVIDRMRVYRCDANGNALDDGNRVAVSYKYDAPSLNGGNTCACVIEYKRVGESSWSVLMTASDISKDTTAYPKNVTFSPDYSYDIRMTVTDWFGAASTIAAILPTGAVILDIKADGKGLAIGKASERDGLEIAWSWLKDTFADQVVEQGVSGIWIYTKWASGKVEMRGKKTISTTIATTWGSLYASGYNADTSVEFPFTFVEPPRVLAALDANGSGAWLLASGSSTGATTTATGLYEFCRGNALTTARNHTIVYDVVGFIEGGE